MLTIIAKIVDKEGLIGFRVIDDKGEVKELYNDYMMYLKGLGKLNIDNIEYVNGRFKITDESSHGYTQLDEMLRPTRLSLVILDQLSANEFKCVDHEGHVYIETIENLVHFRLSNAYSYGKLVAKINGNTSYRVDSDKANKLRDELDMYYTSSALLGIEPLDIKIVGDEAILEKAPVKATEIIIPTFVTMIWSWSFSKCKRLKRIHIPSSVKYICNNVFSECQKLEEVYMNDSKIRLGLSVFYDCQRLKTIKLSDKLISISDGTFNGCIKLRKINIPNKVRQIGIRAFANCTRLEAIEFSEGVLETIGDKAFMMCASLDSLELTRVDRIGRWVFQGCNKLKSVNIGGNKLDLEYGQL